MKLNSEIYSVIAIVIFAIGAGVFGKNIIKKGLLAPLFSSDTQLYVLIILALIGAYVLWFIFRRQQR